MIFINTNQELQKVFDASLPDKQETLKNKRKEAQQPLPATQYQILAERLFPLISMIVLFGLLQVLTAFYYQPLEMSNGFANVAGIAVVEPDMPFAIQVRNTRVGLGMSRRVLAQKVGLTMDNIASIEKGDATPTKEVESALRIVLGLKTILQEDIAANH